MRGDRGVFEKVKGSGAWWICYFDATGHRRREKAGSKSSARKLYQIRKAAVHEGRKLPNNLRARRVLFSELAEDALKYVETHNEGAAIDKIRIEQFQEAFGDGPAEIPIQALRGWFDEHEWEAGTYNRYRTVLSSIYRLGIENKKVGSNPVKLLKRLRESDGRVRFLNQHDPNEEAKLRRVIAARFPEHMPEFDIAVNTGMRRGEQYRRISWANVDLRREDLFVPKSKNGRPRHIPLNDASLSAFHELYQRTGGENPIFASERDGKPLFGPRHWFEDAIREAKIEDFTWHDCRHTFASRLVMSGVPLRVVAELMGHQTIQMTMRYAHLAESDKVAAVRKLHSFAGVSGSNIENKSATKTATAKNEPPRKHIKSLKTKSVGR